MANGCDVIDQVSMCDVATREMGHSYARHLSHMNQAGRYRANTSWKRACVCGDFLRSACSPNDDFFEDSRFNGNVDFDGRGNISQVTFLESVRGRNWIVEPIDRSRWDEIFGFDRVNWVEGRRHEGFLWKEERTMM
jgi:hypothetical protein